MVIFLIVVAFSLECLSRSWFQGYMNREHKPLPELGDHSSGNHSSWNLQRAAEIFTEPPLILLIVKPCMYDLKIYKMDEK